MRGGLILRALAALVAAAVGPLVLLGGLLLVADRINLDPRLALVVLLVVAVGWAIVLTLALARSIGQPERSMAELASGARSAEEPDRAVEPDAATRRLSAALDERNRQLGRLAHLTATSPVDERPAQAAHHTVATVREVTGDSTWRLAVLAGGSPDLLAPGVYDVDDAGPAALGDLEQWLAVADGDATREGETVRWLTGPWGAFVTVALGVDDELRALLFAPWEGRSRPDASERDLLTLVGRHTATALSHAILYARVRAQAEELHRLYGHQADFLRSVTHDLQTPLTSIAALAAEMRATADRPAEQGDLDTIIHQADRLRRMVGQLLVASRLGAGALQPRQEVFAVAPIVERTWRALRADRPFELVHSEVAQLAIGDADRTEQVLWALLDNAVKYSPAASPVRVRISAAANDRIAVAVEDEGTGMSPTDRAAAFQQFHRGEDARRVAPDGSGVGLYAARGLVEAMGGTIALDAELGRGTTVTVELPAEPADAVEPPAPVARTEA